MYILFEQLTHVIIFAVYFLLKLALSQDSHTVRTRNRSHFFTLDSGKTHAMHIHCLLSA